ncbi:MAG: tetratricopeptide repeat protein [Verrucomicrobiia bacterium]
MSLGVVLIVLLTVVAYLPAMRGGFIWDDDAYVTGNQTLRSAQGLHQIWLNPKRMAQYYPLTFTVFWVEYQLWGLNPFGFHLVNVLLQAVNAILLWRLLSGLRVPGAWWAAAIFALHPVTVESVAWITERKNVLSCLFYLLALLAYLRFRRLTGEGAARAWHWRFYPLVLVLFLCALLSKTVTCSLPAVLVLLVWWKTGRVEKRDALALLPLFVLGAALGLMTAWTEKHRVGASGAEWALSFVERCLLAGRVLWFYAGKLFWPRELTFIYPRWEIDAGAGWQYLFPLAALVVLIALWLLRSRIGKGPLVAVLCFAGTLVPALGFFDVYPFRFSFVADHFQYLACIGLITLAVGAGTAISQRAGRWGRDLGALAAAAVLLLLGVSTWRQAHIYKDLETLWRDTLKKNPSAWIAHNNLGVMLQKANVSEAKEHYEQALRLKPDYAEGHNNLGNALLDLGKVTEALGCFEQALRLQPDYIDAYNNLGNALLRLGRVTEALGCFEQALRLNPDHAETHNNLGNALLRLGKITEALEHYEQALRLKPDFAEAHNNLGAVLWQVGRGDEAIGHFEQALRIKPDYVEAHNNLGTPLMRLGKVTEALGHYEQALRIRPDHPEAHNNLGSALMQLGRGDEAIGHYEQALRSNPEYAEAHNNLGAVLWQVGRVQEAIGHYEQALRIKPDYAEAHNNFGGALAQLGRVQEAIGHYEQALRSKPDYAEAHYNLGVALEQAGKIEDATEHYQQALQIKPDFAEAHNNFGGALIRLGRLQEAIGHWEQALRLKPDYAEAHYNLGVALEQAGRPEDAIGHYEQALRIEPDFAEAQNNLARLRAVQ